MARRRQHENISLPRHVCDAHPYGTDHAPMPDFIPVAKVSEIPDPGRKLVEIDERLVVLIHAAGHFYAVDDVCTHDGGPLGEGELDGFTIACPRHGAKFDIRDGRALTMPATRATVAHEVKVVGDEVLVRLRD
jgi:3-phenylpropionate/trans-cinnamate dioxygenase ferredoxin component